jgi:hypothetical protein
MSKTIRLYLLLLILLLISGCLDIDEFGDPNTNFSLSFSIDEGAGEDLIIGNDTLIVIGAKFVIDNIELVAIAENEIFEPGNILVLISGFGLGDQFNVGNTEIFGGTYTGVSYDLTQPDADTEITDPDLVVRNSQGDIVDRFSLALNVIYNNEPFLIKSKLNSRITVSFEENVIMPEMLGVLQANLIGDWKRWFVKDGEILDPGTANNLKTIEENFEKFFFARLFTIGQLN